MASFCMCIKGDLKKDLFLGADAKIEYLVNPPKFLDNDVHDIAIPLHFMH